MGLRGLALGCLALGLSSACAVPGTVSLADYNKVQEELIKAKVQKGNLQPVMAEAPERAAARSSAISASEINNILEKAKINFARGRDENHWLVVFEGESRKSWTVQIIRDDKFVVLNIALTRLDPNNNANQEMLLRLMQLNFRLDQAKLGLGQDGVLYMAYEVPSRLVDYEELVSNVYSLVRWADRNYKQLEAGEGASI